MTECFLKKYSPEDIDEFYVDNKQLLSPPSKVNTLIIGNNGTGKTSLIIKLVNQFLNYKSNIYFDENVLFMNNLKDQGIQYCRSNVKLFCQTRPSDRTVCKKIIAIDDIDEFSDVSQQVICNYINKFSDNIIFLATCTNALKVCDGLKSRMIVLTMLNPTNEQLCTLCENVILNENIVINQKYVSNIIESSNSSYKVLLNTLFKIKIFDNIIDDNSIYELITSINHKEFDTYIELVKQNDINNAVKIMFDLTDSGISVIDILYEFTIYIKQKTEHLTDDEKYKIITLVSKYITIFHDLHEDVIELAFLTNDLISELQ